MGNCIAFDAEPPDFQEMISKDHKEIFAESQAGTVSISYQNILLLWKTYPENVQEDYSTIPHANSCSVHIKELEIFQDFECYIALHLENLNFENMESNSHNRDTMDVDLDCLYTSSTSKLSPRGLKYPFCQNIKTISSAVTNNFGPPTNVQILYEIYLLRGNQSSSLVKASALSFAHRLANCLEKNPGLLLTLADDKRQKISCKINSLWKGINLDTDNNRNDSAQREYTCLHTKQLTPVAGQTKNINNNLGVKKKFVEIPKIAFQNLAQSLPSLSERKNYSGISPETSPPSSSRPSIPKLPIKNPTPSGVGPPIIPKLSVSKLSISLASDNNTSSDSQAKFFLEERDNNREHPISLPELAGWSAGELTRYFDPICSEITDFIYLGSRIPASNKQLLKQLGMTHILNCAGSLCDNLFPQDFVYQTLYLMDGPSQEIRSLFYIVIDFMEGVRLSGGKVFVHCHQGVSRSASMVICYLMWKMEMPFEVAHEYVKTKRFVVSPNPGFIAQLMTWWKWTHPSNGTVNSENMVRLLRITPHSTYDRTFLVAKEVDKKDYNDLDCRTVYLLVSKEIVYLWKGTKSPKQYMEVAYRTFEHFQKYENIKMLLEIDANEQTTQNQSDTVHAFCCLLNKNNNGSNGSATLTLLCDSCHQVAQYDSDYNVDLNHNQNRNRDPAVI